MQKLAPTLTPYSLRHHRLTKLALDGATDQQLTDWAGWVDSRAAKNYIARTGELAAHFADRIS
jgi:hypothetical protein